MSFIWRLWRHIYGILWYHYIPQLPQQLWKQPGLCVSYHRADRKGQTALGIFSPNNSENMHHCLPVKTTYGVFSDFIIWAFFLNFPSLVLCSISRCSRRRYILVAGPLLSGRTSYRKISWSLEATRFGFKLFSVALKFDRHLGSGATEMPVKFQSDKIIITSNLAASRLREIWQ